MRLIFVLLLLGLSSLARAASAPDGVHSFTLDNGMQVVVIEDHRAPVVTHMVWYRVGSANDAAGRSGVAHFLEHLMFKETTTLALGEYDRIVADNGGEDNAFTSYDYTAYFQRVSRDRLDLMMSLEADRMRNLVISEQEFERERGVVLEERRLRVDSNPGAIFSEQRTAALYLNHPYGRPIIGWAHEIEALTIADIRAYYDTYYAPNNAILVVAGDVTMDEVRTLAEKNYGPIPRSETLPPPIDLREPPHLSPRRMTYADARVREPYVTRTYLAPRRESGAQEQAAALQILAALLSSGITSHLTQTLIYGEEVALDAGAFYSGSGRGPGSFGIWVVPASGVSLEEAEARLDAAVATFLQDGPDADHLARIRTQIRAQQVYELDSQQGRARGYGAGLSAGLTVEDIHAWPDALEAVTAEDVLAAAVAVFDLNTSVTGTLTGVEATK